MDKKRASILIVDDSKDNLEMLSMMMRKVGYIPVTADNAETCFDLLGKRMFDLVLLDVIIPGVDGFEILEKIRKSYSMIQLPVIMLTAMRENELVVRALSMGANDYVTKPFDFSVIHSRIRTQISLKQAEEALKLSEERYAFAAQATRDGLWDWSLNDNEIFYSQNWKSIIGCNEGEITNTPEEWLNRVHPADLVKVSNELKALQYGEKQTFEVEYRIVHKNDKYRWVITTGIAVLDQHKNTVRMVGAMSDITERKIYNPLTGLPNEILLRDKLERIIHLIKAGHEIKAALLFIDLDRFKMVNQAFGIVAGDEVISTIASRLKNMIPDNSQIFHHGRDEFLVLIENSQNPGDINSIAGAIQNRIREPMSLTNGKELSITASVGINIADTAYTHTDKIIQNAESAMHRAKKEGLGKIRFYKKEMYAQVKEHLDIENKLLRAIEKNELVLFYQPQVNIKTGKIIGVETLVRWDDPQKGLLPPTQLIPMAEDNGLIGPIGEWILKTACQQSMKWQKQGRSPLRIAVNLSPLQFGQKDLFKITDDILNSSGLDPGLLELEITESNAMEDAEASISIMKRLTEIGVTFSIDDFGTGYSSLSILKQFPLSTLKIDRSFIKDIPNDENAIAIVKAIIAMAHSLKFEIIAEGVENRQQLEFLDILGCEHYQGFLFSKPVPPEKLIQLF